VPSNRGPDPFLLFCTKFSPRPLFDQLQKTNFCLGNLGVFPRDHLSRLFPNSLYEFWLLVFPTENGSPRSVKVLIFYSSFSEPNHTCVLSLRIPLFLYTNSFLFFFFFFLFGFLVSPVAQLIVHSFFQAGCRIPSVSFSPRPPFCPYSFHSFAVPFRLSFLEAQLVFFSFITLPGLLLATPPEILVVTPWLPSHTRALVPPLFISLDESSS